MKHQVLVIQLKKNDYNTKVSEIEKKITDHDHDKYITVPEFNKLTAENITVRLAQANLANKNDIANIVDKIDFDDKLKNLNKTKHLLVKNKFKKLQTFDSSLFISQKYFNNDGSQVFLIFKPTTKLSFSFLDKISEWESKGLSNEKIKLPVTADKSLSPKLAWMNESGIRLRFTGSSFRQKFPTLTLKNVVNLFIVYELDRQSQDLKAKFSVTDCLFGAVKPTKNDNSNKCSYSGYGIGLDSCSLISIPHIDQGKNAIIFGVDMSLSLHANNKNKNILILSKGKTKGLKNTSLTTEAEYSITFSRSERKFCLSLHYYGSNSFSLKQKTLK